MNPWTVLGWMVVGIVALGIVGIIVPVFLVAKGRVGKYFRYLKTRNLKPAKGQRWVQDNSYLTVADVYDNGVIGIRCGNASWGDTPENWKKRVRNRKLYCINP